MSLSGFRRSRRARPVRAVASLVPLLALLALIPAVTVAGLIAAVPSQGSSSSPFGNHATLLVRFAFTLETCLSPTDLSSCRVVSLFALAAGGSPPYVYVWNFGDGTLPGFGQNVTHVFPACGIYTVTVWVTAPGATGSESHSVVVCPIP